MQRSEKQCMRAGVVGSVEGHGLQLPNFLTGVSPSRRRDHYPLPVRQTPPRLLSGWAVSAGLSRQDMRSTRVTPALMTKHVSEGRTAPSLNGQG